MKMLRSVLLYGLLFGVALPGWSSEIPRVAVLDFATADSPGSLHPAVLDFSRAVQAKLLSNNDYAWVERQEFDRISREIDLGGNSRTDPATAVRMGHLLHADLMLRGEITSRAGGVSDLKLEVVDLKRADVLATRIVPVTSSPKHRLHPTVAEVDATSDAALGLLHDAVSRLRQMSGLRVLAPLYFKNTGSTDRLNFLGDRLGKLFNDEATPGNGFRVLRFPRTGDAGEESSLVLAGLTDTDPDAWQRVADTYVWGTFSEQGGDGVAFNEVPVAIALQVWNGSGDPREIKWNGAVKDLDAGLHSIATQVLVMARSGSNKPARSETERRNLAAKLRNQAAEVAKQIRQNDPFLNLDSNSSSHPYLDSTAGRQLYAYWLRLLEVACFFDPLDGTLQRDRLQLAWSPVNPFRPAATLRGQWLRAADFQLEGQRFERLADGSLDGFWPATQTGQLAEFADVLGKAGWKDGKFVVSGEEIHRQLREVTGKWARLISRTDEAARKEPRQPGWIEAQRQAWLEQATFLRSVNDPIIVRDALEQIWPALQSEFGRLLKSSGTHRQRADRWVERLIATYDSFADTQHGIALLDSAWKSYTLPAPSAGNSGAVKPAAVTRHAHPEQPWEPWVSPSPPPLPPWANDPSIPVLAARIREIDPRTVTSYQRTAGTDESLFVKRRAYNLSVDALAFSSGKLWFTEENEALPAALGTPNALGNHYLWSYDPALRTSELITNKLGAHASIRSLAETNGALWLGLNGDGVWRFDLENGAVKRFKGEDGLQTSRILAATADHDQLYFLGGVMPEFFISQYSLKDDKWSGITCPFPPALAEAAKKAAAERAEIQLRNEPRVSVCGDWLCFSSDWIAFFNRSTKQWVDLLAPGSPATMTLRSYCSSSADESGFWLGNGDSYYGTVLFLDPRAPSATRLINVPGQPVAMAHHGPWLWVVLETPGSLSRLGLIDKRTGTFVGQIVLPGQHMRRIVATDDRIWVGGSKQNYSPSMWADGSALLEVTLQNPRPEAVVTKNPQPSDYPLLRAVWTGDLVAVEALLVAHQNANEAAASGWTPLMSAAASGRQDIVARLLAAGANPNLLSRDGESALQQAALRGDVNSATLLLQHGANPNLQPLIKLDGMLPEHRRASPIFDSAAPRQPTDLKAEVTSEGEVKLTWKDCSDNETQFEISNPNSQGTRMVIARVSANATQWIDPSERSETELFYFVRAINDVNASAWTEICPSVHIKRPTNSSGVVRFPYGLLPGGTASLTPAAVAPSPLFAAVAAGSTDLVALLLKNGANPNLVDAAGCTSLTTAARHREYGMVRQLMAAGAHSEFVSGPGDTVASIVYKWHEDEAFLKEVLASLPDQSRAVEVSTLLLDAAKRGQVKDIEMLLALGADISANNEFGESALSLALQQKQDEAVLFLLKKQTSLLQERWHRGQARRADEQIAAGAVLYNDPEILARLLAMGMDPKREAGMKPLIIFAAENKAFLSMKFLVEHGADIAVKDFNGKSVKYYLSQAEVQQYMSSAPVLKSGGSWSFPMERPMMRTGPVEYVAELDPTKSKLDEALIAACQTGDFSAATAAVAAGAELECTSADGKTPLLLALKAKAFKLARWLIDEGSSVNRLSKAGYSPLAFAMNSDNREIFDYLLQAGADIDCHGYDAYSPLAYAANSGTISLVRQLLDAGADPNLSVGDQTREMSPLAVALNHGDAESANLLLARGASSKAQAYSFRNEIEKELQPTLLMYAAFGHNITLIKLMISLGQNPLLKIGDGDDALSWAAAAGSREAVELLLPLSAHKGNALEAASKSGHKEIVELLKMANYESARPPQNL